MINSKLALHYSKLVGVFALNGSNIQWLRCRIYDPIVKTPPQLQTALNLHMSAIRIAQRIGKCAPTRTWNKWPGFTRLTD